MYSIIEMAYVMTNANDKEKEQGVSVLTIME